MTIQQILTALEAMGLAANRDVYVQHGIAVPAYGVAFGHLRALAKQIGTDAATAEALWASGNHDARVLATLVLGETGSTERRLRAWVATLDNYVIADLFARWASHAKVRPRYRPSGLSRPTSGSPAPGGCSARFSPSIAPIYRTRHSPRPSRSSSGRSTEPRTACGRP